MKNTLIAVRVILIAFMAQNVSAAEGELANCNPTNYLDLARCLKESSSELKVSEQQLLSASKLEAAASQWINPDLDIEHVQKGGMQETENQGGVVTKKANLKNAALNGAARATLDVGSEIVTSWKNKKSVTVVKEGSALLVVFDSN